MDPRSVYLRLREHLDRMPVGFPATASGVELRILEHLFSPEEAEIALELSALPETLGTIHRRLRHSLTREELRLALDRMATKGIINRSGGGARRRYGKLMFAIGMYEMQVDRLTERFERDSRQYMAEAFGDAYHETRTPQLRTVPINVKVSAERAVARHDDLRDYVRAFDGPLATMACICRRGKDLVGEPCPTTKLRDNCLSLGSTARTLVRRGLARFVEREEMLHLLDAADADGLVLQPQNTTQPEFVCCCCGCCCGVLEMAKRRPEPAAAFMTSYRAAVDAAACQACATCVERCPMGAIEVEGDAARVAARSCIGCGLCATACPSGAVHLVPIAADRSVPAKMETLYLRRYRERFGLWSAAKAVACGLLGIKV
jgi:Pyruvate/2-oxoacid:ferredoxin oxidoreductase delta subunit